jgi:Na+-translocating ferredoxin:NAD+ oxidoreductase RnfD subunit
MFTEDLYGWADWILPAIIIASGTFLNAKLTRRIPLIAAFLGVFVLQAFLRSVFFDASLGAALNPMTGVAFLLFTYYMLTDPATTPNEPRTQILFGAATAATYGLLMVMHIVFGLFFALTIVCSARGLALAIRMHASKRAVHEETTLALRPPA